LAIQATHFGQKINSLALLTNKESLARLGEMFTAASKEDYSGNEYVYAAKVQEPVLTGDAESCGQEEN
jgi:hypothetical protein